MALASGTRLGPYEIHSPVGAGGMGEVYRARDTRLGREVAVKVLPAAFSRDPERLRRFQQEAQAVAALNHTNILAIHDLGEHEGSPYMVTELLEGESLRSRLEAGALPVRKATEIAEQIARGLAAAHEKGIIHRDLKPENVFVTRDGGVKILDFGLARLTPTAPAPDDATLASQTQPGVVMGTVGYMSPEQVRGQTADHRSDLFSLGAILHEMLSGKRAFHGDSSVEIMNAILKQEPEEEAPPGRVPPALSRIVAHCLEKNPAERFQSARDVAFALGTLSGSATITGAASMVESPRRLWPRLRIAGEVALLVVAVALGLLLARRAPEAPGFAMLSAISPPPGDGFWANNTQPAAISPDGRFLAIIAMRDGHTQLWLGRHDSSEAQPIAGAEDAVSPFWSPDSRYIGFFAKGRLKKADVTGGSITDLCPSPYLSLGGAWSSRGVILYAPFGHHLQRVSDAGGTPEPVAGVSLSSDALAQYWPAFLPDGNHFFYLEWRYPGPPGQEGTVWIGSLDSQKPVRLPLSATNVRYSSGYLLFSRQGDLYAQPFDATRLQLNGSARPIARHVQYDTFFDDASFTASNNGILVYGAAGTGVNSELTWMDRDGKALGVLGDSDHYQSQAISPDGRRVAVNVKPPGFPESIWIYDVDRGTRVLLTPGEMGASNGPRWSPDGKQVAYSSFEGTTTAIYVRAADGSGGRKQIRSSSKEDGVNVIDDWSHDGRYFATSLSRILGPLNRQVILQVGRFDGAGKPEMEINDAADAGFSPDGHWLAYVDRNSGGIYVTPFPGPGARIAISSKGGYSPCWRGDGQEFFYVASDRTLISVQLRETPGELRVLSSKPLFRMQLPRGVGYYDVTRDGKRFLVNMRTYTERSAPLTLVTNWPALLQNESK